MSEDIRNRLGGLLLIAIGIGVGWWAVWGPLHAAQMGAAEVRYSMKGFMLVPFTLVFGVAMLLGGARVRYRIPERQSFTALGWGLAALATLLAVVGYIWFQNQFQALGYR